MASCSGNGSRGHHKFTLNVSETYVSGGADNYSTISWSLVLSPVQTGWDWNYSGQIPVQYNVKINGSEVKSGNIMSYNGYSTVTIASGTTNIAHNSDGSKTINFEFNVWDTVSASWLPGNAYGSGSMDLTKIARYATITSYNVVSDGLNSLKVTWDTDAAVDILDYSLNNGSWVNTAGKTFYVTGLTPNTTYNVKIRVKRIDSQLWTESSNKSATTKDIARITTAPNINFGDSARITKTNPSSVYNRIRIETLNPTTTIATRTQTSDDMTITFTDEEWDNLYKKLGNGNSITIRYVVDTITSTNTYYDWVDRTLTLKGNQKTSHLKVSNSWKRSKLWIKVSGTWRRGVTWVKVNGTWRRGI